MKMNTFTVNFVCFASHFILLKNLFNPSFSFAISIDPIQSFSSKERFVVKKRLTLFLTEIFHANLFSFKTLPK